MLTKMQILIPDIDIDRAVNIDAEIDYLTNRVIDLAIMEYDAVHTHNWHAAEDFSKEIEHCRLLLAYFKNLEVRYAA